MLNNKLLIPLMLVLAGLLIFNQFQLVALHNLMRGQVSAGQVASVQQLNSVVGETAGASYDLAALASQILPVGVPPVYGAELGVSFDNAVVAIPILAPFEQDTRADKLTGEKLARYIDIGQETSCEFCCSATTMVFPDGRKACGCAHSAAMRGVVAFLLETQGDTMTDEQILEQANMWKAVFFPGPFTEKVAAANGLLGNGSAQGLLQQVGGC